MVCREEWRTGEGESGNSYSVVVARGGEGNCGGRSLLQLYE